MVCLYASVLKKYLFIVLMALLSISAGAYTKLTPETRNFVSLHADLGYAGLLHKIEGQKPSSGIQMEAGVGYRLFHNNFIFTLGAEAMYAMYANGMNKLDVTIPMRDTEGELFGMHVMTDKARDISHMANVNIPILFGGEWGRVYFMVGPKVSLNFMGKASSKAEVTTYGEYEHYYDDFYNMTNHQFESGRKMSSAKMDIRWNFNIMAHVEVGGRIGHMFKHPGFRTNPDKIRMYLAVYADYGLLDVHQKGSGQPLFQYRETQEGVQFYIQPLMKSDVADATAFHNLSVGIKYTVAFELPKSGKSYIYDYHKVSSGYIKRGGNQSIQ